MWAVIVLVIAYAQAAGADNKNSTVFNTTTEHCCAGNVYKNASWSSMCCGGESVSYSTHLCCNNRPLARGDNRTGWTCCGGLMYNMREAVCCNGKLLAFNETYCKAIKEAPWKRFFMSCCNMEPYNQSSHICIKNGTELKAIPDNMSTCKEQFYNPESQLCCEIDGKIISRKPEIDTAESKSETSRPMRAQPTTKASRAGAKKATTAASSSNTGERKRKSYQQCCGGQAIYTDTQSCCNGKPIETKSQLCCNGTVYPRTSNTSTCCGSKTYESTKDSCCRGTINEGTPLRFSNGSWAGTQCCNTAVLKKNQICCNRTVVEVKEGMSKPGCCNGQVYDSKVGVCCADKYVLKAEEKNATDRDCCVGVEQFENERTAYRFYNGYGFYNDYYYY